MRCGALRRYELGHAVWAHLSLYFMAHDSVHHGLWRIDSFSSRANAYLSLQWPVIRV
jgi:hypothetical protein